jgi:hypothetical protein
MNEGKYVLKKMANEANRKEDQDKKPKLFTNKDEGVIK